MEAGSVIRNGGLQEGGLVQHRFLLQSPARYGPRSWAVNDVPWGLVFAELVVLAFLACIAAFVTISWWNAKLDRAPKLAVNTYWALAAIFIVIQAVGSRL